MADQPRSNQVPVPGQVPQLLLDCPQDIYYLVGHRLHVLCQAFPQQKLKERTAVRRI